MNADDDISDTLKSKSNQWCADDLTSGPLTITVTKTEKDLSQDRPVAIFFDVDGGRPWRPCLTMRRLISHFWSADRTTYIGRSLTIYRDPSAIFGGLQVGGIRVSHVDGIDKPETVVLQENNKKKKTYTIHPLKRQAKPVSETQRQDTKPADTPTGITKKEFADRLRELIDHGTVAAANEYWDANEDVRLQFSEDKIFAMGSALAAKIEKENA